MQIKKILCIPSIDASITDEFITNTIDSYNMGKIKKLISIPHKNNNKQKRIIIHLLIDDGIQIYKIMSERFAQKKSIQIIYEFPRFWKLVEAENPQKHNGTESSIASITTVNTASSASSESSSSTMNPKPNQFPTISA